MVLQNSNNRVAEKRIEQVAMIGTPYHNTSAVNTATTLATIAAPGAGRSLQLNALTFSYSGPPTGGLITVSNGAGTIYFEQSIVTAGPGPSVPGIKIPENTALSIVLAAGGAGVVGRVSASVSVV